VPFALLMSDPLTLTLADVLADANPFAELVAVMSPVETIVPVLALLSPDAVVPLPPVSVVDVTLIVPVLALLMPNALVLLPPVTVLDVTVIVPVLALVIPVDWVVPPVIVLEVTVIVPVLTLFIQIPLEVLPPFAELDVIVTVPVLLLLMLYENPAPPVNVLDVNVTAPVLLLLIPNAKPPLPPVTVLAFVKATVPAADVDSMACAPFAVVVPVTLPPVATMPSSVSVPLDENAIARVDSVKAEPVAWHPASVELAAAETVKQFAEPACMYAPVML